MNCVKFGGPGVLKIGESVFYRNDDLFPGSSRKADQYKAVLDQLKPQVEALEDVKVEFSNHKVSPHGFVQHQIKASILVEGTDGIDARISSDHPTMIKTGAENFAAFAYRVLALAKQLREVMPQKPSE